MRIISFLVYCMALLIIGLSVGTTVGGLFFVPEGSGMASGVIALGYGLLGGIILLVAGIAAYKYSPGKYRLIILWGVNLLALVLFIAFYFRFSALKKKRMDPPEAYANSADFTVTFQQIKIMDPYLSTRIELKSKDHSWKTTLPNHKICRGEMRAASQQNVSDRLMDLVKLPGEQLAACLSSSEEPLQRIEWRVRMPDGGNEQRTILITQPCLQIQELSSFIQAVRMANLSPVGKVVCK
ncbi:MAG: hypothetical protein KC713_05840 [Candidatus Omnitrophica bacterium]|nr:hypothetical protein [Candidatus Omnitrophota bacterium]